MSTVALADVAQINPRLPKRPADDEGVSFLPMAELGTDGSTTRGEIRPFGEVAKGYTQFLDGDLLVAKITPCFQNNKIGQAAIGRFVGVGSTEFHVVRPKVDRVDARYLLHYLRREEVRIDGERRMTGSGGQRRVPANFLKELELPLLSLDEQRRIAAILDQAALLQVQQRQSTGLLSALVPAIFRSMFGDPDDALREGRTRPFSEVVSDLQGGKSMVAGDSGRIARNRVLKISAVTSGQFRDSESKPLPDDYKPPRDHFVRRDDLLISRANTADLVGAVALVDQDPVNLVLPDKLWRFVWANPQEVEPLYMRALLQMPAMRRELTARSSGTAGSMKNIAKSKLWSMPLPWAEPDRQVDFARRVRAVGHLQDARRGAAFDAVSGALQARAFSGQL